MEIHLTAADYDAAGKSEPNARADDRARAGGDDIAAGLLDHRVIAHL